jgi:hypothetical protein
LRESRYRMAFSLCVCVFLLAKGTHHMHTIWSVRWSVCSLPLSNVWVCVGRNGCATRDSLARIQHTRPVAMATVVLNRIANLPRVLDTTRTDRKRGCYISNCVIDVSPSFILFYDYIFLSIIFFKFGLDNNYQQLDCPTSGARNRFFFSFSYGKLLAAADCIGKGFFFYLYLCVTKALPEIT